MADTDLLIFMQFFGNTNIFAQASPCLLGDYSIPRVGYIKLNLRRHNITNEMMQHTVAVIVHETLHILGFATSQAQIYLNPLTMEYLSATDRFDIIKEDDGTEAVYFRGPRVMAYIRSHFNCPFVTQIRLENNGKSGSLWNHWE